MQHVGGTQAAAAMPAHGPRTVAWPCLNAGSPALPPAPQQQERQSALCAHMRGEALLLAQPSNRWRVPVAPGSPALPPPLSHHPSPQPAGDRAWETVFGAFAPVLQGEPLEDAALHSVVLQIPLEGAPSCQPLRLLHLALPARRRCRECCRRSLPEPASLLNTGRCRF